MIGRGDSNGCCETPEGLRQALGQSRAKPVNLASIAVGYEGGRGECWLAVDAGPNMLISAPCGQTVHVEKTILLAFAKRLAFYLEQQTTEGDT